MAHGRFGGRTLARAQALELVFQAEAGGRSVAAVLDDDYLINDGPLDDYARRLALGTYEMQRDLDRVIGQVSRNWSVSRMPSVDRCLLRVALYEMLEVPEVALAVTIDESVVLAKSYGTDETSRFVNGVLGTIASKLEAGVDVVAEARSRAEEE